MDLIDIRRNWFGVEGSGHLLCFELPHVSPHTILYCDLTKEFDCVLMQDISFLKNTVVSVSDIFF